MSAAAARPTDTDAYQRLVQRVVAGGIPHGVEFDACRAVLATAPRGGPAFHALCMLLEGALADPSLDIEAAQVVVPLLRELARGSITVERLL